jgi:hypothetical protein
LGQGNNEPWLVAAYMVTLALLTTLAIYFGPETYRTDITATKPEAGARL